MKDLEHTFISFYMPDMSYTLAVPVKKIDEMIAAGNEVISLHFNKEDFVECKNRAVQQVIESYK